MANVNKPMGLSPVKTLGANNWNAQTNLYYIAQSDSNAYAPGDPVVSVSGGADANGVPGVTLATAGASNRIRGVIVGVGTSEGLIADPKNLDQIVIPATKTKPYYVMVCDDPSTVFEVQEWSGSGSTAWTAADIGKNVNLKSGTNNGFYSAWTLDDTAASATTVNNQVRLIGIARRPDNAFGAYCKFLVMINQHELALPGAGV